MKRMIARGSGQLALILTLALPLHAQVHSPFNGLVLGPIAADSSFRVVFSGHFHGESNNYSGFPAATLLAGLDTLNASGAAALISTGDLFMDPRKDTLAYRTALFDRLRMPLFNVVGNHDLGGGSYARTYGTSFLSFDLGRNAFILLDSERDDGGLKGEQLEALRALALRRDVDRAFIVSHRPLWAESDPVYGPLFVGNTRAVLGTNYVKDVQPMLEAAAEHMELVWVSGSMAGGAPASVFMQRHTPRITFVQSAIRNTPRDAMLVADIGLEGVRWSMLPLTPLPPVDPTTLDAAFWTKHKRVGKESFNWRLLPYLVRKTVFHASFAWGSVAGAVIVLLLVRLFRRRR